MFATHSTRLVITILLTNIIVIWVLLPALTLSSNSQCIEHHNAASFLRASLSSFSFYGHGAPFQRSLRGYITTWKGKVKQLKKDHRQNCYVSVPAQLAWRAPDHHRQRLAALLVSSFAQTDGLRILLAQTALAVSKHRQLEIMHVIVGSGADGKSMICVDLLRTCFGSAFGNPACTILQVGRNIFNS